MVVLSGYSRQCGTSTNGAVPSPRWTQSELFAVRLLQGRRPKSSQDNFFFLLFPCMNKLTTLPKRIWNSKRRRKSSQQRGTWPFFVEIAIRKSLKNYEEKSKAAPRYNQQIARKSSLKLPVTSQNPWKSAKFEDSITSRATSDSISGRSADCI